MYFEITNEKTSAHADEIVEFLQGPRLYIPATTYSDQNVWLKKVHTQFKNDTKIATTCFDKSMVTGVIVYQKHPQIEKAIEIRNITVRPETRGRLIGSFLLHNTELEAKNDFNANTVYLDCKVNNYLMLQFLLSHGYEVVEIKDLYGLNDGDDVILKKCI